MKVFCPEMFLRQGTLKGRDGPPHPWGTVPWYLKLSQPLEVIISRVSHVPRMTQTLTLILRRFIWSYPYIGIRQGSVVNAQTDLPRVSSTLCLRLTF